MTYLEIAAERADDCRYHLEVVAHLEKVIGRERDEAIIEEHNLKALSAKNEELRYLELAAA